MLTRIFAVASLVAFAVATDGQCNTGDIQCCESYTSVENYNNEFSGTPGFIAIVADAASMVGSNCSPLTIVGTGSGCEANQEPLCCSNNEYNGLVNIGCTPINLNL
ncbi:fungal hydrophobin-domain-containing protein [Suillus americanus]|nr:fungal hydrophobin-domain-containing protein [Suillus americanus]